MLGGPMVLVWCISYPQSVAEFRDVEGIVVAVAGEELDLPPRRGDPDRRAVRARSPGATGATPRSGAPVRRSADSSVRGSCSARCPVTSTQMNGAANVLPFLSLAVLLGLHGAAVGFAHPRVPRAPHHRPRRAGVLRRRAAERVAGPRRRRRAHRSRCSASCWPVVASASADGCRASSTCANRRRSRLPPADRRVAGRDDVASARRRSARLRRARHRPRSSGTHRPGRGRGRRRVRRAPRRRASRGTPAATPPRTSSPSCTTSATSTRSPSSRAAVAACSTPTPSCARDRSPRPPAPPGAGCARWRR